MVFDRGGAAALLELGGGNLVGGFAEFDVEHVLQRGGIPSAIVQRHIAARAKRFPELLHERIVPAHPLAHVREQARFLRVEVGGYVHRGRSRIEVVEQIGYAAAFARSVPALEQDGEADALRARLLLQDDEAFNQLVVDGLVLRFRQLVQTEFDRFEHGFLPHRFEPFFRSSAHCRAYAS